MNFRLFILSGIVCLIAFDSLVGSSQNQAQSENQPAVVKAVPAPYPAIAMAANVSGSVIVEVKINAKGEVTSADAIEGHKPLQKAAEYAAKRWIFSPTDEKNKKRSVRLTFSFILIPKYSSSADLMPVFMPPYKVEVIDSLARIVQTTTP
jgi:TonB family protein